MQSTPHGQVVVAIDGGKSAVRIAVADGDQVREGTGPGFVYRPGVDDVDAIVDSVAAAFATLGPVGPARRVCAGLTGVPGDVEDSARLAARLGSLFGGCPVDVVEDSVLAHAGALNGPGVVVCAGTGTAVLGVAADGNSVLVDGWGPLLGDRGSGFAVGREGLRAAAAAIDGCAPPTSLTDAMKARLDGAHLASLQRFYRAADVQERVARFAEDVAAHANRGDEVARDILVAAGHDLAQAAICAARRLGLTGPDPRVAVTGRLVLAGAVLTDPLSEQCRAAGLDVVPRQGDSLQGGLLLAARSSGLYEPLLNSSRRAGGET